MRKLSPTAAGLAANAASEASAKAHDVVEADAAPIEIRTFAEKDEDEVVALWDRCGLLRPWNDPHKDIARKLHVQRDLFLVGTVDGTIVATVMGGYDGHRGWVNYINFQAEDEGSDRIQAAYGANYDRLAEVKGKWDSANLFRQNRNIAPKTEAAATA